MYFPKYNTFRVLIPLLKAYGIRNIVISPGSRMREFVLAVEEDPFFTTYDVTDERSASYFALGLSQQLQEPVVITCTSSTATTNYTPGVTEAFYQNVPIVVLTGDRDPIMLGQQEDQMIDQVGMYDRVMRKSVSLPIIKDEADSWYCQRLICEALLELNHHKTGPVHINVPVPAVINWGDNDDISKYPAVKVIKRYDFSGKYTDELNDKVHQLCSAKRILVFAGQNFKPLDNRLFDEFFNKYNCVIHAEHMGNVESVGKLNLNPISDQFSNSTLDEFMPDIVISLNGTLAITRTLKEGLRKRKVQHWLVDEDGAVVDAYKNLTTIFEGSAEDFLRYFIDNAPKESQNDRIYYNMWADICEKAYLPELPMSHFYTIQQLIKNLPCDCILDLSILNSIRISQFFELPKGTKVYANIGTDGIDGCLSSFFGQSVATEKECFMLIGDLSFFYDMSSLRIKHIRKNCHICLINNHGGNEFYIQPLMPTTPQGLGASHTNNAKDWAQSVGFTYLSASTKDDVNAVMKEFVKPQAIAPVLLEVFTDQMTDRETTLQLRSLYHSYSDKMASTKQALKNILGDKTVNSIRSFLGKK